MEILKRLAFHAGSWYSADKGSLIYEITRNLEKTNTSLPQNKKLKGIISPHAGFRWSGPTAAWGYVNINPNDYKRVFLLGPSHHAYFVGCGLTKCKYYETPLGDIEIDTEIIESLLKKEGFISIDRKTDEKEHSLEMQLPFLKHMFGNNNFTLVPIIVGNTTKDLERTFGKILSEYYKDNETLFVISSDFCHWGNRFRYTYYNNEDGKIHESIEKLDKWGMQMIETQNPEKFTNYLQETMNTICGRKPITIFLHTIQYSNIKTSTQFVRYDQSSKVIDSDDSSVSYAVAINYLEN